MPDECLDLDFRQLPGRLNTTNTVSKRRGAKNLSDVQSMGHHGTKEVFGLRGMIRRKSSVWHHTPTRVAGVTTPVIGVDVIERMRIIASVVNPVATSPTVAASQFKP